MPFPLNFIRVHDKHLSLWQSVVSEYVRQDLTKSNASVTQNLVLKHPLVQATADHVKAVANGTPPDAEKLNLNDPHQLNIFLSYLAFQHALCLIENDTKRAEYLESTYRKYSDKDPGFLLCEPTYLYYYAQYKGVLKYNDWTIEGNNNINYGVIPYTLPNDAKVAIIGDWGTGLADAQALLTDIIQKHNPAALIHLGDIYYSGTPSECSSNFYNIIQAVFKQLKVTIPVFTIPGNHDYYAFGYGYYEMVSGLNTGNAVQEASYFCLRTADNGWQFLGMDTGYNDADPLDQINPLYSGPYLHQTEIAWHTDKLKNFDGATILLSHHQVFTANGTINGSKSSYWPLPFLNPYIYANFLPFLQTKIAAWMWGHEHNFAMFENNLFNVAKGRLLGCSAYEEIGSLDPYKVNNPQVPYFINPNTNKPVQLNDNSVDTNGVAYYNHAYGIIDFGVRTNPSDPVNASYYEFPSWGDNPPVNPSSTLLYEEQFTKPVTTPKPQVMYADTVNLIFDEVMYLSSLHKQIENYPTLATNLPVNLQFRSTNGSIGMRHGDTINIITQESSAGSYTVLGAWSTPTLYYYSGGYTKELWTVIKVDRSNGNEVHYGDLVLFLNQSYNQYLSPYWSKVYGKLFLTTSDVTESYWSILQPAPDFVYCNENRNHICLTDSLTKTNTV